MARALPTPPTDADAIAAAVRALVARAYGDDEADYVIIHTCGRRRLRVDLPKSPPAPSGARQSPVSTPDGGNHPGYSEMEAAVIEVLSRGGVLTGPRVAELTGYPYDTGLKTCLAALRRRGIIVNRSPGYALAGPAAGAGADD
jgi:hypothetical protein